MARLDSLNLKPDPENQRTRTAPNRRSEDEQRRQDAFVAFAEMLLDDDRFAFAADTITSMRDGVKHENRLPTDKMFQALENIREGGRRQRQSERNWGRRYEGR